MSCAAPFLPVAGHSENLWSDMIDVNLRAAGLFCGLALSLAACLSACSPVGIAEAGGNIGSGVSEGVSHGVGLFGGGSERPLIRRRSSSFPPAGTG